MTLAQAQTAFRTAPSQATALAYMDAAIAVWAIAVWLEGDITDDAIFRERLREIRDWLAIPQTSE